MLRGAAQPFQNQFPLSGMTPFLQRSLPLHNNSNHYCYYYNTIRRKNMQAFLKKIFG